MIIRKEFRVESAHIVRNCTSHRCSHSIHGHSAVIEVFLESSQLDNAQMIYDFGLMKGTVKQFIDSMDHCYLLCSKDSEDFQKFIMSNCDRWIMLPFNPSAEMLSMYILNNVQRIIDKTVKNNGEDPFLKVSSVRYWETTTGYSQASQIDLVNLYLPITRDKKVIYSPGVIKDWSDDLRQIMLYNGMVSNPVVDQQINLRD